MEPQAVNRFEYAVPSDQVFWATGRPVVAVSPDGRQFVYNTGKGLYLRTMGELQARLISGIEEDRTNPFFSPDGETMCARGFLFGMGDPPEHEFGLPTPERAEIPAFACSRIDLPRVETVLPGLELSDHEGASLRPLVLQEPLGRQVAPKPPIAGAAIDQRADRNELGA